MFHWLRDPALRRDLDRIMLVDWHCLRSRARGLVSQHPDDPPPVWREELTRAVERIENCDDLIADLEHALKAAK